MIYLDHNATTPVRPEVAVAISRALDETWGNPSSVHAAGRKARTAIEGARHEVAELLGCSAEEIVFSSGGTEGNNWAVGELAKMAWSARAARFPGRKPHVVSSPLEHPSIHGALQALRQQGYDVTLLPVAPDGRLACDDLQAALREETVLVTLALANHEIGNVYDVAAFATIARQRGCLFHTDIVQGVGRVPLHVALAGIDAATLSAHKIYGPKGVGAVFLRRGLSPHALIVGGHQERQRRAGTENVPGIVGFGMAAHLASTELRSGQGSGSEGAPDDTALRLRSLRDHLEEQLLKIPDARVHGGGPRTPGTTNLGFAGCDGQLVMIGLDLEGVCVSTGAACTSGSIEPSPVLLALGLDAVQARQGVRFSVGRDTTDDDIDRVVALTTLVVARIRAAAKPGMVSLSAAP